MKVRHAQPGNALGLLRVTHEVACAANLSVAGVSLLLSRMPEGNSLLFQVDLTLSKSLGLIPIHADLSPGYFQFEVPLVAIAICFWFLIRIGGYSNPGKAFVESGAGLAALVASPLVFQSFSSPDLLNWVFMLPAIEIAGISTLWAAYAWRKAAIPDGLVLGAIALHYVFWFVEFGWFAGLGWSLAFGPYAGPLAPTVGLSAGLAWFYYFKRTRAERESR